MLWLRITSQDSGDSVVPYIRPALIDHRRGRGAETVTTSAKRKLDEGNLDLAEGALPGVRLPPACVEMVGWRGWDGSKARSKNEDMRRQDRQWVGCGMGTKGKGRLDMIRIKEID